jgi:SAM-dependent methyltransferase
MSSPSYVLDNAAPQAATRLNALAEMFDPGTIRHLEARGIREGWRCLEIGGGGGSIVRWLADRVGPTGYVLATDIDTRHLESSRRATVEILPHNIATDPLPTGQFDLIHARLVFNVLPNVSQVLARLVAVLKSGGWLVSEDFETHSGSGQSAVGTMEVSLKTTAAMRAVMRAAGINPNYGRDQGAFFRGAGLTDVEMEGRSVMWRGGTAGAALTRANREQLREAMLATGRITEGDFEDDMAQLDSPEFEMASPILWTTWGRRAL